MHMLHMCYTHMKWFHVINLCHFQAHVLCTCCTCVAHMSQHGEMVSSRSKMVLHAQSYMKSPCLEAGARQL